MNLLRTARRRAVSRWQSTKYRIKMFGYGLVGKNPYRDGTVGSLEWKLQRGKPLTEEEKRARDELEVLAHPLREHFERSRRVQFHLSYIYLAMQLMRNLPKDLRDDLGATSIRDVREKFDVLLPLASYQREQTAIKLAACAVIISALAFLISAATLAFAIWTSISVSGQP